MLIARKTLYFRRKIEHRPPKDGRNTLKTRELLRKSGALFRKTRLLFGHSSPLFSFASPANQDDRTFLGPLLSPSPPASPAFSFSYSSQKPPPHIAFPIPSTLSHKLRTMRSHLRKFFTKWAEGKKMPPLYRSRAEASSFVPQQPERLCDRFFSVCACFCRRNRQIHAGGGKVCNR